MLRRSISTVFVLLLFILLFQCAATTAFAGTWSLKSSNAGYSYYFNNANGYFFALDNGPAYGGVGGRVKWSTDLVTWTDLQTVPYVETGYGVVYGNSRYVLASGQNGNTGHLVYSADPSSTGWSLGQTVAPNTPAGNAGDEFYSLACNGSTFVAGSANGYIFRSTDGASWTSQGVHSAAERPM